MIDNHEEDYPLGLGGPSVRERPRFSLDGSVVRQDDSGPDRLLKALREVHGKPRYDIPLDLPDRLDRSRI